MGREVERLNKTADRAGYSGNRVEWTRLDLTWSVRPSDLGEVEIGNSQLCDQTSERGQLQRLTPHKGSNVSGGDPDKPLARVVTGQGPSEHSNG